MDAQELGGSRLSPPYKAKAIANYFLARAEAEGEKLTPMKLQKLIYFAHGWCLGLTGKPLIDELVQAWDFGPVIRTVYDAFKAFGADPIKGRATSVDFFAEENPRIVVPEVSSSDQQTRTLLDRVWAVYKPMTAYQLSNLTHQSGTPWDVAHSKYRGIRNAVIEDETIKAAFEKMANDNRQRRAAAG